MRDTIAQFFAIAATIASFAFIVAIVFS